MKTKNVKKLNLKLPLIFMGALSALFFACGVVYAVFGGNSYKYENSATVSVSSVEDMSGLGKNASNDNFRLTQDIRITDPSFILVEEEFTGVFDGCGHTVYFDYTEGADTTSLFNAIGKDGVVKNTRFVFSNVNLTGDFFSGVAKINRGTMQDCVVEYDLQFSAKEGAFTPFVNVNYGTVKNIVTKGTFTYLLGQTEQPSSFGQSSQHSPQRNEDEKKICFASVCVYNFGTLKNVIATPRFNGFYSTLRENYLAGRSENIAVASVCSFIGTKGEGGVIPSEQGLVTIQEKSLYTSDDTRLDHFEDFKKLITGEDNALNKTVIENTYDFNNNVWQIEENEGCLKLKTK